MADQQFRIPKLKVPVVCHTEHGERISGDIFLDIILSEGYDLEQALNFFNSSAAFFPIRTEASLVLLRKRSVVQVDMPQLMDEYKENAAAFGTRKDLIVHLERIGRTEVTVLQNQPVAHSRILDLVNVAERNFFPAIANGVFVLLSLFHVYKIEELENGETR